MCVCVREKKVAIISPTLQDAIIPIYPYIYHPSSSCVLHHHHHQTLHRPETAHLNHQQPNIPPNPATTHPLLKRRRPSTSLPAHSDYLLSHTSIITLARLGLPIVDRNCNCNCNKHSAAVAKPRHCTLHIIARPTLRMSAATLQRAEPRAFSAAAVAAMQSFEARHLLVRLLALPDSAAQLSGTTTANNNSRFPLSTQNQTPHRKSQDSCAEFDDLRSTLLLSDTIPFCIAKTQNLCSLRLPMEPGPRRPLQKAFR